MTVNPVHQKIVLYLMLFATLTATAYFMYLDSVKESANEIVMPTVGHQEAYNNTNADKINLLEQKNKVDAKTDIFEVYKKASAEPEKQLAVTPKIVQKTVVIDPKPIVVAPSAPPVPFKYIGKIWGDDAYQVFIGFEGKYLVVKEGDIIQKTYKIEKITPPTMTITYMPMNILQNMPIGEKN